MSLPWRTLATSAKPSACSAPSMALPCGSSTPFFSVMVMRALMAKPSVGLDEHRPRPLRLLAVRDDPEPARHLLVSLDQAAHVAAEAILVELVARLDVPQPAVVRRDLVGDHGADHL